MLPLGPASRLRVGSLLLAFTALPGATVVRAQEDATSFPDFRAIAFGDITYVIAERDGEDGFRLGQLVGHLNASLTQRLTAFGEMSATPRDASFVVSVERIVLRYDFADQLKVSAGRFHTPASYWNVAYHHGMWLQTSVGRPEAVRFGSELIPIHFLGLVVEGTFPRAPLGPGYTFGVGNGRHEEIAHPGDAGDANAQRALLASLHVRPAVLYGLQVGGGIYVDRVPYGEGVDERILSAHLLLEREPEVIAEYFHLRHDPDDASAVESTGHAYHVQVGYRLPGRAGALKPYARVESVRPGRSFPMDSPDQARYDAAIVGVRADFAPFAALKAEYRAEERGGADRSRSVWLQASFAIARMGGAASVL